MISFGRPLASLPVAGTAPLAGVPAWRELYREPPDVRMEIGPFCPLDDTRLWSTSAGWTCPVCRAHWDLRGLAGGWLPAEVSDDELLDLARGLPGVVITPGRAPCRMRRRLWLLAVPAAAGAVVAGWFSRPWADRVPVGPVLAATVVLGSVACVLLVWAWASRRRLGVLLGTCAELELPADPAAAAAELRARQTRAVTDGR